MTNASAKRGICLDVEGEAFYDPHANEVLFNTLRNQVGDTVEVLELENAINDDAFAIAAANKLMDLLKA